MDNTPGVFSIAYLSPEPPALSSTFVFMELLGLERRGLAIAPFAVHLAQQPAPAQLALAGRTKVLYDGSPIRLAAAGLLASLRFGGGGLKALRWLASDIWAVGPWRMQAWKLAFQWARRGPPGARPGAGLRCTHLHVHFAHVPAQIAMYASAFAGIPFTIMAHANDIFERGLLLPRKAARSLKMLTISRIQRRPTCAASASRPVAASRWCAAASTFETRADIPSLRSAPIALSHRHARPLGGEERRRRPLARVGCTAQSSVAVGAERRRRWPAAAGARGARRRTRHRRSRCASKARWGTKACPALAAVA